MLTDPWQERQRWAQLGVLLDLSVPSDLQKVIDTQFDVIVVGSGAAGAVSASRLALTGKRVLILESGGLYTAKDFNGSEGLYETLYKNGLLHSTLDGGINLLQGHCVGGSATVNWTSSFRLPKRTEAYWSQNLKLSLDFEELSGIYTKLESRLNIEPWAVKPNANNQALASGAASLGWSYGVVPRNVKGCWNLGLCGVGCPTNAKQSPLVTTIPDAINSGACLAYNGPVQRLLLDGKKASGVVLANGALILASKVVLAAGAVNSPGILLRSGLRDSLPALGESTCLHPTCFSIARFPEKVHPYYGAPQSIYSDHFLWPATNDDLQFGFKLEAVPLQPVLASGLFSRSGQSLASDMKALAQTSGMIALLRDGFDGDRAGQTLLDDHGGARVKYPVTGELTRGAKLALLKMAQCQFEAGATEVRPGHLQASQWFSTLSEVSSFLATTTYDPYQLSLGSAHLMGGAKMGAAKQDSVVNTKGAVHGVRGLYVVDASVFPTSLGVNPQLTVMAVSELFSQHIASLL